MKKTIITLFLSLVVVAWASAQDAPKSPRVTAVGKNVSIAYGQPSKRDRVLFGPEGAKSLEKYGKVWRTGANEATEITFKKDGKFGGASVKAGTYTLFTVPGEKEWKIILNSQLKQFGAYDYEKYKDKDVVTLTVPAKTYKESSEKMTFTVKAKALDFQWDKEGFSVPLSF